MAAASALRKTAFSAGILAIVLCAAPLFAADTAPVKWSAPNDRFIYIVEGVLLAGTVVSLLVIRGALASSSKWSIADALSEETEMTAMELVDPARPDGPKKPVMVDNKPVTITEMRASSSRMIALMGMVMIMLMFLGFGSISLFSFAKTGEMPASIDKVINYLLAGMTLFAPYLVNKFASVFQSLSPKPKS
jgi:hypothetical protein